MPNPTWRYTVACADFADYAYPLVENGLISDIVNLINVHFAVFGVQRCQNLSFYIFRSESSSRTARCESESESKSQTKKVEK